MANISKLKLPNGTTHTIKDSTARSTATAANTLATSAMNNIATIESSSTASKAYSVGDYLVYNSILYKVISAINSGETLTPNTNIEATTTGAELTALNNGLTDIVTWRNVSISVTIPANGSIYDQALNVPTISGFKAFAIGGWRLVGGGYADSPFTRLNLNEVSQKIEYAMMTRNGSAVTVSGIIKVLYIRTNWCSI